MRGVELSSVIHCPPIHPNHLHHATKRLHQMQAATYMYRAGQFWSDTARETFVSGTGTNKNGNGLLHPILSDNYLKHPASSNNENMDRDKNSRLMSKIVMMVLLMMMVLVMALVIALALVMMMVLVMRMMMMMAILMKMKTALMTIKWMKTTTTVMVMIKMSCDGRNKNMKEHH